MDEAQGTTRMRYNVEVKIPAVITLRGHVHGEDLDEAKRKAVKDAKALAKQWAGQAIMKGRWPEAFDGANAEASPEPGVKVTVDVQEPS